MQQSRSYAQFSNDSNHVVVDNNNSKPHFTPNDSGISCDEDESGFSNEFDFDTIDPIDSSTITITDDGIV